MELLCRTNLPKQLHKYYAIAALRAGRPSRNVGQEYSQAVTFWGGVNVLLCAFCAQLGSQLGYISQTKPLQV